MKTGRPKRKQAKIFGRREVMPETESFSAERAVATWSMISPSGTSLLTQNIAISWSQAFTRVYEIGSNRTYIVAGRQEMNWEAARVIAPGSVSIQFYRTFSPSSQDLPEIQCRTIKGGNGTQAAPSSFVMTGFEIAGVGLQVAAGPMTVQDQVTGVFEKLDSIAAL